VKTNLKLRKKFIPTQRNFSEEKDNRADYQVADDEELLAVSEKIIKRNKKVYAELAK